MKTKAKYHPPGTAGSRNTKAESAGAQSLSAPVFAGHAFHLNSGGVIADLN
jgi:hypothetical protein